MGVDKEKIIIVCAIFKRWLQMQDLWDKFLADFNPSLKNTSRHKYDGMTFVQYIHARCENENGTDMILQGLIDRSLYYRHCKYQNWLKVNKEWWELYKNKIEKEYSTLLHTT